MTVAPQHITQTSTLPPAQPAYVLRGHLAQIHAVHFFRENLRLISGDAQGWIIVWDIPIRRPVVVWRAHKDTILGVGSWGKDKIITHGRDSKLHVWQLRPDDETSYSSRLPVEDSESQEERKQPWLLHSLTVNTANFCSFAMRSSPRTMDGATESTVPSESEGILIATPSVQDGYINITALPSENRVATIPTPKDVQTGMVMAIALHYSNTNILTIVAGYESGYTAVWQQQTNKHWQTIYVHKAHTQPILSLAICTQQQDYFTSSADAIIARHPLEFSNSSNSSVDTTITQTKHAGQQSLTVRSDQKLFATAGWDGRARVYSTKTMSELAVLKWHKEGCYALAFAELFSDDVETSGCEETAAPQEGIDEIVSRRPELTVSQRRVKKAKDTHWLAVGSKDGKISLWDVY